MAVLVHDSTDSISQSEDGRSDGDDFERLVNRTERGTYPQSGSTRSGSGGNLGVNLKAGSEAYLGWRAIQLHGWRSAGPGKTSAEDRNQRARS